MSHLKVGINTSAVNEAQVFYWSSANSLPHGASVQLAKGRRMDHFKRICHLLIFSGALVAITLSTIIKNDYGYENIVVAIHRDVKEDPRILENIMELFTKASEYLFKATGRRVYFKNITIAIPSSWFKNETYQTIYRDYFSESHIRIADPNPEYGDTPYTLQPGECGEEGEYVHLTPKFIKELKGWTAEMYGEPERQLVHEWAHFRYGVFDEYGSPGDERYPMFYQDGGKIYPTSCTKDVKGWIQAPDGGPCYIYEGGIVSGDCIFIPDMMNDDISASIMYMPFIPSIEGFCQDEGSWERRHNWKAPSKQNAKCSYRSTWEVISNHKDFKRVVSHPGNPNTTPTFRLVQVRDSDDRPCVLVLDISGSMKGKRISLLRQAASRFVEDLLPDNSSLGIVTFNKWAQTIMPLTRITSMVVRRQLSDKLPKHADGATAIGAGLREGLKALKGVEGSAEGGLIILITDGEETDDPTIRAVMPELIESGVTVNSVAFGPNATIMLEELTTSTGGRSFLFPDLDGTQNTLALDSAFMESISTQVDVEFQPVTLFEENINVSADGVLKEFVLDLELGKNTAFTAKGEFVHLVNVWIESPSGRVYNESSPQYDEDSAVKLRKIFRFPSAQHGLWKVHLKSLDSEVPVSVTLISEARDAQQQPVRAKSWISDIQLLFPARAKVYAIVTKGFQAIINATVRARVDRPNGDAVHIILNDNGAGADSKKDDGVYSAYFTEFNGQGRYAVVSTVVNDGYARLKLGGAITSPGPIMPRLSGSITKNASSSFSLQDFQQLSYPPPTITGDSRPTAQFIRNANAGSFRLAGWVDQKLDKFPPSRIQDLMVISALMDLKMKKRLVSLQWTSVGDDYDVGIAASIEIRASNTSENILKKFNESFVFSEISQVHEGSLEPLPAQVIHRISLILPDELAVPTEATQDVYFAVRTIDDSGLASDVSNIASAHYGYVATPVESEKTSHVLVVTVIAVIAAFIMVITLAVVCVHLKRRKRMMMKL